MGERTVRTTSRKSRSRMRRIGRLAVALIAISSLLTAPALAANSEPSVDLKILDAVFIRPLTAVKVLFGVAAFMITAPVAYLFGAWDTIDEAREIILQEPAADLFERPLGDL